MPNAIAASTGRGGTFINPQYGQLRGDIVGNGECDDGPDQRPTIAHDQQQCQYIQQVIEARQKRLPANLFPPNFGIALTTARPMRCISGLTISLTMRRPAAVGKSVQRLAAAGQSFAVKRDHDSGFKLRTTHGVSTTPSFQSNHQLVPVFIHCVARRA